MKVTVKQAAKKNDSPFPKLMTLKEHGGIFLINKDNVAMCIDTGKSDTWSKGDVEEIAISAFTDFEGTIELSND